MQELVSQCAGVDGLFEVVTVTKTRLHCQHLGFVYIYRVYKSTTIAQSVIVVPVFTIRRTKNRHKFVIRIKVLIITVTTVHLFFFLKGPNFANESENLFHRI